MLPLLTLVTLALVGYSSAQTSLYIPGFDPQPVTANEIGVGANGETTWLIEPGVTSGSLDDFGFFGPATLIAGPSAARIIYDDPSGVLAEEDCVINGNTAECTVILASGTSTSTDFVTETVSPFEIQGGGPLSSDGSGTPTQTPSAGSSPVSGASQTVSGASQTAPPNSQSTGAPSQTDASTQSSGTPPPTSSTNGVAKLGWSVVAVCLSGVGAATLLFV